MKLLHIDSSVLADNSVSRKLTAQIVAEWSANHADTSVDYLDLATRAPSHLSADSLGFRLPAGSDMSDVQKTENAISEALVQQFLAADVIVASTRGGMYSTSEGGRAMEHQESYLQTVFGFFGVTDVRIVRAEGLAMGDAGKAQALASAETDIKSATKQAANAPVVKQVA